MKYYFRCIANPRAPLFVTDQRWEALDMAKNDEYLRVDAEGRPLQDTKDAFDNAGLATVAEDLF